MKTAIILHGFLDKEEYYKPDKPTSSNSHWLPWLQKELQLRDFKADTPEVFQVFKMDWGSWVDEIERFTIDQNTILVGHSMGGGFWVRYLSEHPEIIVDKVILVAPWINLNNEQSTDFFEFKLNKDIAKQAKQFIIFGSDNDYQDVQNSVDYLAKELKGSKLKVFHQYGHFTDRNLKDKKFPELLEACL